MADAFPLQWPAHVRRTPVHRRVWGSFQVTPQRATDNLIAEIRRSGGKGLVISSNRPLRLDGLPRQGAREPEDSGVAVYFERKGQAICIPCDSFDRVWKNIRAIGLSVKDMRGPESRGCSQITDQAFTGFLALPSPESITPAPVSTSWWEVLEVSPMAGPEVIRAAYKAKARIASDAELLTINLAKTAGLAARQAA